MSPKKHPESVDLSATLNDRLGISVACDLYTRVH
jgi:hypothetical protein